MKTFLRTAVPLLAALLLAGCVGSARNVETTATPKKGMGYLAGIFVDTSTQSMPVRKLVVPRMLAGIVMAPVLTVVADFVGIVGGWIVARFQLQVASGIYWSSILRALYMQDIWMGLIKPFALGFVIVSVACHVGLRTSGGTQGVGRATTVAVVTGSVGVIAVDFFITRILISLMY